MRAAWLVIAAAVFCAGCAPILFVQKSEDPSAEAASTGAPTSAQTGVAQSSAPASGSERDDGPSLLVTYPLPPEVSRVQILADKHPNRPAEVLGVFDFHTDANSEDKGFDQLRLAAWRLGADAVIGAEFEHGDDGGKSHLSGMAVRFLDH